MHILALEPYWGGSHRSFIEGWQSHSRHRFTVLHLPAHHWKWRMRHGPWTFAERVSQLTDDPFDCLWLSSMVPVHELRGLLPNELRQLPIVVYFHENQLTYPLPPGAERDLQYGWSEIVSCLSADAIWFNSGFHRDEFCLAAETLLDRMPDFAPTNAWNEARSRMAVESPGIERSTALRRDPTGNPRIAWVGRWEADKNPEMFFGGLIDLRQRGIRPQLVVLGERFERTPDVFAVAREKLSDQIEIWGYRKSREEYLFALAGVDIVVSTAHHEFFGIAIAEAVDSGALPLLPDRLAYPEVIDRIACPSLSTCFYDGSQPGLVARLTDWLTPGRLSELRSQLADPLEASISRFDWYQRAMAMDRRVDALVTLARTRPVR